MEPDVELSAFQHQICLRATMLHAMMKTDQPLKLASPNKMLHFIRVAEVMASLQNISLLRHITCLIAIGSLRKSTNVCSSSLTMHTTFSVGLKNDTVTHETKLILFGRKGRNVV